MKFYPEYYIGFGHHGQWYRFQSRGQDVSFDTEQEAIAYLAGVAGKTRVVCA